MTRRLGPLRPSQVAEWEKLYRGESDLPDDRETFRSLADSATVGEKELSLMADLVPLLKRHAGGRDLSRLIAYQAARRKPSGDGRPVMADRLRLHETGRLAPSRWNLRHLGLPTMMNDDPLAYFITWTCYGTWLPGDERSWTKWHHGEQIPQPLLADWCREQMVEKPVVLDELQRALVNETISRHCELRAWRLHAVNCRSNHCHSVVTAPGHTGRQVRDQLKSWSKRKLKDHQRSQGVGEASLRELWWTRSGSVRYLFDEEALDAAIVYTLEAQDVGGSKANL